MKHLYSLVHLTNISCPPPEMIRVAARAGYDAVSLRTIPMGLRGSVPMTSQRIPICFVRPGGPLRRQASCCTIQRMPASRLEWMCRTMNRRWRPQQSWASGTS